MTRTLLAGLFLVALVPAPSEAQSPAPAETIGVMAVSEPPGPPPELVELTRAFRSAVASEFRGVMTQEELRLRMVGQTGASLTELDRAYTGAVAAYQAGDYEAAARTLRAVVDDLERLPESDATFQQWSRAMLRLARAEGSLGRKGESRDGLERLLRADPAAKADPELYPPSFQKQLEEVRQGLRTQPKLKLVVTAGSRAARVYVEGRDAGLAPVTLPVVPGRYRVSGLVGDVRASAGVVEVTDKDQNVALDFTLAETFRPKAGPGLALEAAQRVRGIVSAGATLKLDRALVASLAKDGDVQYLVGGLYDVRRGMLQREGLLRLSGFTPPKDGLSSLASFLATGERLALVEIPRPGAATPNAADLALKGPPPAGAKDKALLRWSPIATGVAAVGLGIFAGYQASVANDKYDQASGMLVDGALPPGADPATYSSLLASGDSARTAAWVSGGAAIVAAVATGVLGYMSHKQTGEVGPFRF